MTLPKILAPLLPQSQCLQQKQNDSVLSPVLPMSPPSYNPYNNIIGLDTEETSIEVTEESTTETAIILHEKPTSFDMCDNDLLIESFQDEPEQQQKEITPMPVIEANTAINTNTNTNTSYQSIGPSSSSLTESGNETLVEITPEENIKERIMPVTPPTGSITPVTPSHLTEEEHVFTDTMDQQQDIEEAPFKPAIFNQLIKDDITKNIEEIENDTVKYTEKEQEEQEEQEEQGDFSQPIQAVYTTHQTDIFDEPQEPDFMMKSNFKKAPSREGSLKSKCMKLIRGMKFRHSQDNRQTKKVTHLYNDCIKTYIFFKCLGKSYEICLFQEYGGFC